MHRKGWDFSLFLAPQECSSLGTTQRTSLVTQESQCCDWVWV